MGKIKIMWRDLSLKKSIALYIFVFAALAMILSAVTSGLCHYAVERIKDSYPPAGERYYLTNAQGERLGEGAYISTEPKAMSEMDERFTSLLENIPIIATPVYCALCIFLAALLFYRGKLKVPIEKLRTASEKISHSDLAFKVDYSSKDELGRLCASFEMMREALSDNFSRMWRQVEERKTLNAAFAHDLRTPLTVLKGYNELLRTSDQIHTREIAATMEKHIVRMENYVASMSHLRRMEDMQPDCIEVLLQPFFDSLCESGKIVCEQKGKILCVQNDISVLRLSLDSGFVSQVCNNLIANAARYAKSKVVLSFELQSGGLFLSVSDDGKGFNKNSLYNGTNPYFTEEDNPSLHFGLGLYICKVLCEHHGGWITLENNAGGGAKVSACFKVPNL
ncbi:signal transduction histidine kinase [Catenibacillus scindens]|uniref:histidine kinase n=1 Tax=Catenibacillus scindens TaxID=673271 RepID=A0A7W8M4D1_9FIRM|nr:signal transduction histidine kinase [Catenibacillus scindens]